MRSVLRKSPLSVQESFLRKIQGSILKIAEKGESRHAKQLNKEGSKDPLFKISLAL